LVNEIVEEEKSDVVKNEKNGVIVNEKEDKKSDGEKSYKFIDVDSILSSRKVNFSKREIRSRRFPHMLNFPILIWKKKKSPLQKINK